MNLIERALRLRYIQYVLSKVVHELKNKIASHPMILLVDSLPSHDPLTLHFLVLLFALLHCSVSDYGHNVLNHSYLCLHFAFHFEGLGYI